MSDTLISKLMIGSFKSIVGQEIELGQINVFVGANGSGKSNIIEALGVLSAAASGRVDDESLIRRGVRPGVPRLYKSAFAELKSSTLVTFAAYSANSAYRVRLTNPLEHPEPSWKFKSEELISNDQIIMRRGILADDHSNEESVREARLARNPEQGLAALKTIDFGIEEPAAQLLDTLRDYAIYTPNTPALRGLVPDPQTRYPIGLAGGRLAEAVQELKAAAEKDAFLEEALDELFPLIGWMEDFDASPYTAKVMSPSIPRSQLVLRFRDRYMQKSHNILTAYDASEGALYVFFAALLALLPAAPATLAIDNFDQALNPRLLQELTRLLCKWVIQNPKPRQLLLTAHNPLVLDGLDLQDDRIRLFTVDRNNKGHTYVKRVTVTPELVQLSQEKGWPLSRLWTMGMLGGVPNV